MKRLFKDLWPGSGLLDVVMVFVLAVCFIEVVIGFIYALRFAFDCILSVV